LGRAMHLDGRFHEEVKFSDGFTDGYWGYVMEKHSKTLIKFDLECFTEDKVYFLSIPVGTNDTADEYDANGFVVERKLRVKPTDTEVNEHYAYLLPRGYAKQGAAGKNALTMRSMITKIDLQKFMIDRANHVPLTGFKQGCHDGTYGYAISADDHADGVVLRFDLETLEQTNMLDIEHLDPRFGGFSHCFVHGAHVYLVPDSTAGYGEDIGTVVRFRTDTFDHLEVLDLRASTDQALMGLAGGFSHGNNVYMVGSYSDRHDLGKARAMNPVHGRVIRLEAEV